MRWIRDGWIGSHSGRLEGEGGQFNEEWVSRGGDVRGSLLLFRNQPREENDGAEERDGKRPREKVTFPFFVKLVEMCGEIMAALVSLSPSFVACTDALCSTTPPSEEVRSISISPDFTRKLTRFTVRGPQWGTCQSKLCSCGFDEPDPRHAGLQDSTYKENRMAVPATTAPSSGELASRNGAAV